MKKVIIEKWSNEQYFINSTSATIKKSHPWLPSYLFMKYPKLQEIAFIDCRLGKTFGLIKTLKELSFTLNAMNKTVDDLKQCDYKIIEVK